MRNQLLYTSCCMLIAISSCTSLKKYDDLNAKKTNLEQQLTTCTAQLAKEAAERNRLQNELLQLNAANKKLVADSTQTGVILRKTKSLYGELNNTYEKLAANYNRLMANSANETNKLSADLARREAELQRKENDLKGLEDNLRNSRGQIEQLSGDLQQKEQKLKELEKALAEKDAAVANLKNKVTNALLGFKDNDLSVTVKNGKVYVSMAEQLLFKSGSSKVDPKGQEALQKIARVLKEQQDVNIVVEGHTDDVPISKGTAGIQDNWDLSVLRATEITRILEKAGVPGLRITPSGRGEHVPLEVSKTAEARQKNRRTEIILTPKLDELFQILEKN